MKKNEFAKQYRLWTLAQYKDKSPVDNGPHIPSFAAVKSLIDSSTHSITKCLHANPPLPSDRVRCYIHNHDQFPGCAETKGT